MGGMGRGGEHCGQHGWLPQSCHAALPAWALHGIRANLSCPRWRPMAVPLPPAETSVLAEATAQQVAAAAAPREGEADLQLKDLAAASQLVQVGAPRVGPRVA